MPLRLCISANATKKTTKIIKGENKMNSLTQTTTSTARSKEKAIEVQQLTKTYSKSVKALDGLTFSVKSGSVFGLLGPNGAGKSTAVKVMTTLTKPDRGKIEIAGLDVTHQPEAIRRIIGCVAQKSGVDPQSTGRENLTLQGQMYGLSGPFLKSRISGLLERFDLTDAADRVCRTYSGGMQRKLDIAMGLIHRPQVLFLDEPTTGLDPEARSALWENISQLAKGEGLTVLLTTHYLEEADQLADQMAIVDHGKVVTRGSPEALKGELHGDALHIELAASDSNEQARRILDEVEEVDETMAEKDSLYVRTNNGARAIPVVLGTLEESGIKVSSATISRPSLDDVYLRYTGQTFSKAQRESD
ncbi:ATP-binding cassette domain-containing protein [Virgibacillus saliphilus]|uniref:ATP-binding cassette domain-containing protein n=1 Tax=Virgibacillus saliphilus TaxID=2831674 RepID=UPI0028168CF9|nr:ATP-binding cassette domain-containing protein [Virgibacillus sp. NKC19-3]